MRENDFEKHVQQKLDELQLRPSKEVWEGVEDVLRKEKKRRRLIIFWWLLPVLLIGSGAAYLLNKPSGKQQLTQTATADINNRTTPQPDNNYQQKSVPSENDSSGLKKTLPVINDQQTIDKHAADIKQRVVRKSIKENKQSGGSATKTTPAVNSIEKIYTLQEFIAINQHLIKSEQTTVKGTLFKNIIPIDIETDSFPTPSVTESKKKNNKSKWIIGVAIKPAIANTHKGKLFESSSDALFAVPSFTNNSGANPLNNSVSPVAVNILEPPVAAFSGNIEVFVRKQLNKRFHLQTGIQYSLLRSRSMVGSNYNANRTIQNQISPNASVSNFYGAPISNIQTHEYMNHYHLLGLTGALSWDLIQKRKFRLSWDNGVTVNRLLATNALHYDAVLRGYYQDFKPYRKTQLFLTSGFTIPYYTGKKYTLSASPFAAFGVTSLLKSNQVEGARLYQFGVSMNLLFSGK